MRCICGNCLKNFLQARKLGHCQQLNIILVAEGAYLETVFKKKLFPGTEIGPATEHHSGG